MNVCGRSRYVCLPLTASEYARVGHNTMRGCTQLRRCHQVTSLLASSFRPSLSRLVSHTCVAHADARPRAASHETPNPSAT